ncbi:solute carrier organic anion transporter family member 74D [Drosophila grimshawi]|uniref:Solute carrier organic anion transporter family member n=1 Tax=Drosophila grimshawi TaxID=7222 RepID=B4J9Q2_DROGR|nr:solute carrier organic anion transporter family member 74D [Drosophila grimshawi]EDW01466.1 GH20435 [Drosophila grimshawi]
MSVDKKPDQEEEFPFLKNGKLAKEKPHKDIRCGFWIFKGPFLQRLATEKAYVLIYGLGGCLMSMSIAYFTGTLTTLEKRYKIPTKLSGLIIVGNDVSMMITSVLAGYFIHKGHRARWIGFGYFTVIIFCLLTSSLHFIYGPGEDALKLTRQFGDYDNSSDFMSIAHKDHKLCMTTDPGCIEQDGTWVPPLVMFIGQFIAGIGISLFWTVGIAYMDDNISKEKTPAMLSISAFLRMLGPAIGYSLASVCLRVYIDPELDPLIQPGDPRWLGAWWIGFLVLAGVTFIFAFLMTMFPKELPSAKVRRINLEESGMQDPKEHKDLSISDMVRSIRRLVTNKVYMYNTFASSFYLFGYFAYWIYTPKYIETQYRQSASVATMATGAIALGFSAAGVLISGFVVSKYKPSGRAMAAWNACVDFLTVAGILCYVVIGCEGSDKLSSMAVTSADNCSASCHCEYVHYAPICSPNNDTYISACHAGCTDKVKDQLGRTLFTGCACVAPSNSTGVPNLRYAVDGACPVDCTKEFIIFLVVMCLLKLIGSSSKSTSLLISLRCIKPEDKSLALGLGGLISSLSAFIPSPIFFGWLLDKYCLVWGKTCSNKGNCWLYDTESLRYAFNLTTALFIFLGGIFNVLVWHHAEDLKIFDDEPSESNKADDKVDNIKLNTKGEDVKISEKLENS